MTHTERKHRFDRLFASIDAPSNAARVRRVCELVGVKPGTVYIWRMKKPPAVPSVRTLELLQIKLAREAE